MDITNGNCRTTSGQLSPPLKCQSTTTTTTSDKCLNHGTGKDKDIKCNNGTQVEPSPPINSGQQLPTDMNKMNTTTTTTTNSSSTTTDGESGNPLDSQCENFCDLNNNTIINSPRHSLTHSSNLFVHESNSSLDLNGKSLHSNVTSVNSVATGSNVYNNSNQTSPVEGVDLRSDEIREDIEILVDIYLLFENATWLLSAFMW